jgi:hypothetical protein
MWKALEKALEPDASGHRKIHHIGISNFNVTQIEDLLAKTRVKPYVCLTERYNSLPKLITLTGSPNRIAPIPSGLEIHRVPPEDRHPNCRIRTSWKHQPRVPLPQLEICWPPYDPRPCSQENCQFPWLLTCPSRASLESRP